MMFKFEAKFKKLSVMPAAVYFQRRKEDSNFFNKGEFKMAKKQKCEIYSRVVGYLSPLSDWNKGKKEEFKDRQTFKNGQ